MVDLENGTVTPSIPSLGGILRLIREATKSLGKIPAGQYRDYQFDLLGLSWGVALPQVTVSGRWGWPAGDAGKNFSVPASLDQDLVVDAVTITSGPSGNPNPVSSGGQVNCTVSATDSRGHSLNYQWSATGGTFSNPNVHNTVWTPQQSTTGQTQYYTLSVSVTSSGGKSASRSYQQRVLL